MVGQIVVLLPIIENAFTGNARTAIHPEPDQFVSVCAKVGTQQSFFAVSSGVS